MAMRFFLFNLLILFPAVQTTDFEAIKTFTEKFAPFNNESTDVEKLFVMARNPQEWIKYAVSATSLIGNGIRNNMTTGFENETEEYEAFEYLQNALNEKFNLLKEKRAPDPSIFTMYQLHQAGLHNHAEEDIIRPLRRDYEQEVTREMAAWASADSIFIYDMMFKNRISTDFNMAILSLKRFADHCSYAKVTKADIRNYVRVQQAIREADSRVKRRTSITPDSIAGKLENVKTRILTYTPGEKHIAMLGNIYAETLDDLLKELWFISADVTRNRPSCDLQMENLFYGYRRLSLLHIARDLLTYQWLTMVYDGIADEYPDRLGKTIAYRAEKVVSVAENIASWYQSIQKIIWPEIYVEAAKRAIGFDKILPENFHKTASLIQKELEQYGEEYYFYQVLITETRKDAYWSAVSKTDDHAHFADFNGIDCHIFRYNSRDALNKTKKVTDYFQQNLQNLQNVLESEAYSGNTTSVMHNLLQTIDFFNNTVYNSAILLLDEAFLEKNSKIYIGEAFLEKNNTNSVEFSVNRFYKTARAWKFYLFI